MSYEDKLFDRIRERFPHMPRRLARQIANQTVSNQNAGHNGAKDDYIYSIVAANIRHNATRYDSLFGNGFDKQEARRIVQPAIDEILEKWQ